MAEAAIAESDAAIKANQMVIDGFYNTEWNVMSRWALWPPNKIKIVYV
jgi:hypothetical protein